jgi:hypothetical protein
MANEPSESGTAAPSHAPPPIPHVPAQITLRLTPEQRLMVGRLLAREQEKLRKAGSLLPAPTPNDLVRAIIEQHASTLDAPTASQSEAESASADDRKQGLSQAPLGHGTAPLAGLSWAALF